MKSLCILLLSAIFSLNVNAQNTYVPDDNFEQALIDSGFDPGVLDNYVPTAIISNISWLDLHDKDISDLTGIEDFTSLLVLDVSENNLTSLDASNNTSLILIQCYENSLTSIDVSNNTALTHLICYENSLTNIDVSNNIALTDLYCYENSLTRLNLGNNQLINNLDCSDNELIGLNLKNGKSTGINSFNALNNPDLECIQVDDPAYSTANWTDIDPTSSFRRDCRYGATYGNRINQESVALEIKTFDNGLFSMYPNPVIDVITITSNSVSSFSILDVKGQVLKQGALMQGNTEIDLSQFEQGMYFLNVKSDTETILKKIIKK